MILIIDNYDSFTFNLYQYLGDLGAKPEVIRNDKTDLAAIRGLKPERIVLSPGPGHPGVERDFGVCRDILQDVKDIPVLGVCLGHQGIILNFGGTVEKATKPMHGKTSSVKHDEQGLFRGIKNPLSVMRYHSLVGRNIPDCLNVNARSTDDNEVMAVSHKEFPIYGIQFHPESIMTEDGKKILDNFLRC